MDGGTFDWDTAGAAARVSIFGGGETTVTAIELGVDTSDSSLRDGRRGEGGSELGSLPFTDTEVIEGNWTVGPVSAEDDLRDTCSVCPLRITTL